MKIKIEYGVKKGKKFSNIIEPPDQYKIHELSRLLTGTTHEYGYGIFELFDEDDNDNTIEFRYGEEEKIFEIPSFKDKNYPRKLVDVINEIKTWVKSIDYTKTIEFEISE